MTKEELEKEADEYIKANNLEWELECYRTSPIGEVKQAYHKGAEYGYNKAKEEMQAQDYSLFEFVMQYENGKFKCKYKSGKEFESVDGETWKEIVLPKESE